MTLSATYFFASKKAGGDIRAAGERQVQLIAHDLASILDKFETLPFIVGYLADVRQVLHRPDDQAAIQNLNLTFQSIQRQAKVYAIYLMDKDGNTLASSNWDQSLSFVGRNFSFRPYFRSAIQGEAGRFYGIGSATGEPGYFIAQPVYPSGAVHGKVEPIGVVAVKIDLTEFENTWQSSEDPMALADDIGVVFLSNKRDWKYHSLRPLDRAVQQDLEHTLQYANHKITPIASLSRNTQAGFGDYIFRPIGRLGWQLMWFPSQARIARIAMVWVLTVTLFLAIVCVSVWAVYQRRRRLEERLLSRNALQRAAKELDKKIAQRTEELLAANQNIESKYTKLKETEHLLRSTQNELVQAGKLAMLGQMAAGVTHELSQPLTAIRTFAENAVIFLSRGQADRAGENLSHISDASARMGTIIGQLKGFARKSHEAVSTVDLAKSIEVSALLLQNDFHRYRVRLDMDIRERVKVMGDETRAEQVLINLMRNALDAVKDTQHRTVTVVLERKAGDAVIRIRDSGAGIPAHVAPHLFEAFFTTKPSGEGLGLGLAISSSIVQAMNGRLIAHNHADGGAEFLVRLPLSTTEPTGS
jgi:two-component system C4-dicarboxylate transport sensor histidine kinase DctB